MASPLHELTYRLSKLSAAVDGLGKFVEYVRAWEEEDPDFDVAPEAANVLREFDERCRATREVLVAMSEAKRRPPGTDRP